MTLSIDTNRHRPLLPPIHGVAPSELRTPNTSSTNTTLLWSARTASTSATPSTALSNSITYDQFVSDPATSSEWLISKIDEYLADLHALPLAKPAHSTLRIDIDPQKLLSVEPPLPSSPETLRAAHHLSLRRASMPSSPVDFDDDDFSSPLFYRWFARPDGAGAVREDAAPFPYSPCDEVCLEPVFAGREAKRRTSMIEEAGSVSLPSIRLESVIEGECSDIDDYGVEGDEVVGGSCSSPGRDKKRWGQALTDIVAGSRSLDVPPSLTDEPYGKACLRSPATPPKSAASLHVPHPPRLQATALLPPAIPPRRNGLSRSASAGNLCRVSPAHTSPAYGAVLHPIRPSTETDASPTSTQIVSGVRKVNKLKKLLGEEVGSHITSTPSAGSMKPLPLLPLQRSATMLASPAFGHKHKKSCPSASTTSRPSSARDRCNCQASLMSALTGTGLMPPTRTQTGERPSTSAWVHTRSATRDGSFFEFRD